MFEPSRRLFIGLALFGWPSALSADERPPFSFFYAFDCPHCHKAKPFVAKLEKQHRELRFESWEVKKSPEGRRRFAEEVKRLKIRDPGVPLFVCGNTHVIGLVPGETEKCVRKMIAQCKGAR